jgi:chromosome partitioning protein
LGGRLFPGTPNRYRRPKKSLSLIAQEGGTGKTTVKIHLAVEARLDGLRVVLLDLDAHTSARDW